MRHAGPTRREIGVRTAFNLLGPLTNPAGTRRQLLGVGDVRAARRIAEVVHRLGTERTLVIHGDGVDELPLDGTGVLYNVTGVTSNATSMPRRSGSNERRRQACRGRRRGRTRGTSEAVLRGEPGARRDVVCSTPEAAFMAAGHVDQLEDGIERAALTIDAGLTAELLEGCARNGSRPRRRRPRREH